MMLNAGAHRGSIARRQQWMMVVVTVFALYVMVMLQMWSWSTASRGDLGANISAERAPVTVSRSSPKQVEELPLGLRRVAEPLHSAPQEVAIVNEQQNLRVFDSPLSAPGTASSSAVEVDAIHAIAPITALTALVAKPQTATLVADRHDTVFGYAAAIKYLANYMIPNDSNEQLFLFFVCGDDNGEHMAWRKVCVDAATVVYDVFAKSSTRNRLVTIYAGSKADWSKANAFYNDADLKVKMLPALMQWHGGRPGAKRATSGMIIETGILYEPLLYYLFRNEDVTEIDPLLAPDKIASKEIVLLKGYKNYRQYIDTIASGSNPLLTVPNGPMFFFFIAGRLERNDRPWCPYCRYSDISVEYAFYAFAPPMSRLVKVETVDSYTTWKNPQNEWRSDTSVMVRGVPWMYRATLDTSVRRFNFTRVTARFDHPDALQGLFQGFS